VAPFGRAIPAGRPGEHAELPAAGRRSGAAPDVTEVGLPKRTRRANLAPQLRRDAAEERPPMLAAQRSPEEIRNMMSSFQSNFGRGLADGQVSQDGDDVGKVT
jgi:hypothetical protein